MLLRPPLPLLPDPGKCASPEAGAVAVARPLPRPRLPLFADTGTVSVRGCIRGGLPRCLRDGCGGGGSGDGGDEVNRSNGHGVGDDGDDGDDRTGECISGGVDGGDGRVDA